MENADGEVLAALPYHLRCKEDSSIIDDSVYAALEVLTIVRADHASRNPGIKEEEWVVVTRNNNNDALDSDNGMGLLLDSKADSNKDARLTSHSLTRPLHIGCAARQLLVAVVHACQARLGDASVLYLDAHTFLLEIWLARGPSNNVDALDQTANHVYLQKSVGHAVRW